ncbi:MAG: hypothetical protein AAGI30_02305 [Planctomycetota bacterium]
MRPAAVITVLICSLASVAPSQGFATHVVEYRPAPGQFVNNPSFNDPTGALGSPVGGGTFAPNNSKLVSLGGFGGTLVLGFAHPVLDDPRNPFGVDAIVFGNAFWVGGNPFRKWAEAATIEISADVNTNGLADDPWFLIDAPDTDVLGPLATVVWNDTPDDAFLPAVTSHYPQLRWDASSSMYSGPFDDGAADEDGDSDPMNDYATAAHPAPSVFNSTIYENPLGAGQPLESHLGFADVSPVLALGDLDADNTPGDEPIDAAWYYTTPDDPMQVGISSPSCGGDGFDIAWAIDPTTGQPGGLDRFDFIRLRTAAFFDAGVFGELSPEIGGVADVRPVDALDIADFARRSSLGLPGADLDGSGTVDDADAALLDSWVAGGRARALAPAIGDPARAADLETDGAATGADVAAYAALFDLGEPGANRAMPLVLDAFDRAVFDAALAAFGAEG